MLRWRKSEAETRKRFGLAPAAVGATKGANEATTDHASATDATDAYANDATDYSYWSSAGNTGQMSRRPKDFAPKHQTVNRGF